MVAWGGEVICEFGWSMWVDCLKYRNSSVLLEMVCSILSSSLCQAPPPKQWLSWNFQLNELEFILEAITEVICSIPSPPSTFSYTCRYFILLQSASLLYLAPRLIWGVFLNQVILFFRQVSELYLRRKFYFWLLLSSNWERRETKNFQV